MNIMPEADLVFSPEFISKEFCFWLADNLRLGNLTKDEAEGFVLAFQFGLTKSQSLEDLISYLEGVSDSFPSSSKFISRLLDKNKKQVSSDNKNLIIEFAQKSLGEPEVVSFLEEANKTYDLNILAEKFPKFKEFLNTKGQ